MQYQHHPLGLTIIFPPKGLIIMSPKELTKRYTLFIISLLFSGIGVAFTKTGALGVSPISSLANVLSLRFPFFSIGEWLIVTNLALVAGQIVILRREFRPIELLQIPLSFLFGYFTDFGMWIASFVPVNSYPMQLVMVVLGVVILGFGISLSVAANVIMNAGEAFVRTLAAVTGRKFGNVKIAFDVGIVAFSAVLSLVLFGGRIEGIREGTLIAAFCTGLCVKLFSRAVHVPLNRFLEK